ncbi:hypothetical protein TNCT_241401 [Trichonephila clavata]|uniref:Uncharacterized protein n=1 Tax=Trichonephila clavata TaxID=2740835 RepID=A0A8X6H763_TRICU|nr:hypothetical protein TNCT_241401 [Trichonephila clavata]
MGRLLFTDHLGKSSSFSIRNAACSWNPNTHNSSPNFSKNCFRQCKHAFYKFGFNSDFNVFSILHSVYE